MSRGSFANETQPTCAPPLLDQALYGSTGGYQAGRYCGLGSFEDGTTCCFPCPIQDWLYPSEWEQQLRVPNYLSIFSVALCSFLLLSFAVLPPSHTHRHYLSVGLLVPVLFISLSFVIPVGVNPSLCYDEITPHDMHSSMSCAWTGSLVTLGGLGCAVWVFLRSLWLHIRIFWDRDPGRKFKWGSIIAGTVLPIVFLVATITATGFSYRMGQTCLPNQENAIKTFWVWLVIFSIAGFLLQVVTTGYCVYVYFRSLRRARQGSPRNSIERGRAVAKRENWKNVKKLFLLQWRNILVSVFTIVGSIAFFIVFWTQDDKLGKVFNDPNNIKPVKTWIICQTLSRGLDKEECRRYVSNFTVPRASVLTSLILASLVGIEIFILLFRFSMLLAWRDLFLRLFQRAHIGRPPTPELTSLGNPEQYNPPSPRKRNFISGFTIVDRPSSTNSYNNETQLENLNSTPRNSTYRRPGYERMTSDAALLPPNTQQFQSFWDSSAEHSRAGTPTPFTPTPYGNSATMPSSFPFTSPPTSIPSSHPFTASPAVQEHESDFLPTRDAPSPPPRSPPAKLNTTHPTPPGPPPRAHSGISGIAGKSFLSRNSRPVSEANFEGDKKVTVERSKSSKLRGRISQPVPGSFVHVNGVTVGANPVGGVESEWDGREGSWEEWDVQGRAGIGRGF